MTLAATRPHAAGVRTRSLSAAFRLGLLGSAALLALVSAAPARADDVGELSAEQQASLARAISLWTSGLVGGENGGKYTVTATGDHYTLEVPINGPIGKIGARVEGDTLTAAVKSLDGDRWSFEDVKGPESVRLIPPPGDKTGPIGLTQKMGARSTHLVIDPSLATSSTFDSTSSDSTVTVDFPKMPLAFHADTTASHAVWQPAADGRVDASSTSTASGVTYDVSGDTPFKVSAKTLSGEGHMTGYAPAKIGDAMAVILQMVATITPDAKPADAPAPPAPADTPPADSANGAPPAPDTAPPPSPAKHMTPEQRAAVHKLVDAMRDLYVGADQSFSAENVDVAAQGHAVSFKKIAISQGWSAPAGRADFKTRFALDGLDSPDVPPGAMHDYIPRHIVLAQHIFGLPMDDLVALLNKAIDSDDPKPDDFTADGMALLAKGPLSIGIDEFGIDVDKSQLSATGLVKISSPDDVAGTADIKLAGFDALMKRANSDPMLKQAAPVLIFLKGIGQQDGDTVVWKVVYADKKITVNGTDMSAMMPPH